MSELPTTLEWKDKPDVPGVWLAKYPDTFFTGRFTEVDVALNSDWDADAYALLKPDPPPEPKPENLKRGELTGEGEGIPCVYVDFVDKYGMVPLYRDGEWQECIAERVRPSTGKD